MTTAVAPPRAPASTRRDRPGLPGGRPSRSSRLSSPLPPPSQRSPGSRSCTARSQPDEAGFLLVGQQWQPGGTSLYGSYWVDRPPLLVTIFRVASDLGGAVPLRLMGCLATVLIVVLGCAHARADRRR